MQELPRYIALTAERMLVLETETAGGISAQRGRVKSNHHLTELVRTYLYVHCEFACSRYPRIPTAISFGLLPCDNRGA
jgi:hypothetical protein